MLVGVIVSIAELEWTFLVEAIPLWCIASPERGGLGWSLEKVGYIQVLDGIFALLWSAIGHPVVSICINHKNVVIFSRVCMMSILICPFVPSWNGDVIDDTVFIWVSALYILHVRDDEFLYWIMHTNEQHFPERGARQSECYDHHGSRNAKGFRSVAWLGNFCLVVD